jgi:KDO2-lipid IV(A) lauroyltransferase
MTLAARLVRQTGATPILAWGERLPRGRGYVIHVLPFDETLGEDGDGAQAESAAAVNRAMERLIRQRPQQYLWAYHRYTPPRVDGLALEALAR